MSNYKVNISNGSGSQRLPAGNYDVSAEVFGYDSKSLSPKTFLANLESKTETFTISAIGSLTVNVNETGLEIGSPIIDGKFIRCSKDGTETYGDPIHINEFGVGLFNYIPFGTIEKPYTIFIKQISSDNIHNVYLDVISINMSKQNQTIYIKNSLAGLQEFLVTDKNYSGLNIDGSLLFNKSLLEN
ncbi:MAG: hypothetical protein KFW09_02890 [Oscillospiraceae bacterium]|nr:hypothetical protein [Oscillospiraceae bacterium]